MSNISNYTSYTEAQSINNNLCLGSGILTMYSGLQPATANDPIISGISLINFQLPDYISNIVTPSGTIIFGAINNAIAYNDGIASFFRITNSGNTILDGTVGTIGTDIILSSTTITSGMMINLDNLTYTITQ